MIFTGTYEDGGGRQARGGVHFFLFLAGLNPTLNLTFTNPNINRA
jgi:hypothetical protein